MSQKFSETHTSSGDDRRPYHRPRLTDLGDVRELTQALLTPKGANDGMVIGGGTVLKTGGLNG